ncbi:MAG: hypothetical protein J3K34DRAFT_444415 [Monoraphidium minutum]|nr:MAG: hypothetical protein J3K34DRAFT_444415 [Monoraphidium minutum]
MRKRGAAMLMDEASKGIQGLQRGLEEGANTVAEIGVKHVQSVLRDIEHKVADFQRQQQRRDHALEAAELRSRPVDVQVGCVLYEDAPQEMRARLYYVLVARPDLAGALRDQLLLATAEGAGAAQHIRVAPGGALEEVEPAPSTPFGGGREQQGVGQPGPDVGQELQAGGEEEVSQQQAQQQSEGIAQGEEAASCQQDAAEKADGCSSTTAAPVAAQTAPLAGPMAGSSNPAGGESECDSSSGGSGNSGSGLTRAQGAGRSLLESAGAGPGGLGLDAGSRAQALFTAQQHSRGYHRDFAC